MGDLDYQTLILEYQVLRNEIADRIRHQFVILGGSVALWAAAIPILFTSSESMSPTALLFLPVVSITITGLYLEQGLSLAQAATYIHQHLRPAILARLPVAENRSASSHHEILGWESFRKKRSGASVVAASAFRFVATLGPGVGVLSWLSFRVATDPFFRSDIHLPQYLLGTLDLLLTVASLFLICKVILLYRAIVPG